MTEPRRPEAESANGDGDRMVGRVLSGRYEILGLIAEGGMGRVYEARQRALDRKVAVKCIHPHLLATEQMVVRFMEEARVASQLVHPNVVQVYDFGRTLPPEGGTLFIVVELLSGRNLSTVIAEEAPLDVRRTQAILSGVLSALGEAHARGITHRDAKPDNVLLERTSAGGERVKVIDFGIAKVHGVRGVTAVGQFIGTPHYMPPEQIRGEAAEVSADLYAVGVTLFQMLTGRLPFDAGTVTGVFEKQLFAPRPDPRDFAPRGTCPAALAEVCMRALHVDPGERYPTAEAFADALDRAVRESQPPRARRASVPGPVGSARAGIADERGADAGEAGGPARPMRSVAPGSGVRQVSLSLGEELERAARKALASSRHEEAIALLLRGLEYGATAFRQGDAALGRSAITVFGRLLGLAYRETGRLPDSLHVLREALPHAAADPRGRARLLAEMSESLLSAGRASEAEIARVEALRLAGDVSDRVLTAELRRRATATAAPGRRSPEGRPGPRGRAPPPASTLRVAIPSRRRGGGCRAAGPGRHDSAAPLSGR